jgi:hypothetical protein
LRLDFDMVMAPFALREDYWDTFELREEDVEFLYNLLLEAETPLTTPELVEALVKERIRQEKIALEQQRTSGGDLYMPKEHYTVDQNLIFPALDWKRGKVVNLRPGYNPDLGDFEVVQVRFDNGEMHEFAAGLDEHALNQPLQVPEDDISLDAGSILRNYREDLAEGLEEGLEDRTDFVRIAGRWFPRALLVDINVGHLNLAEAVLDMAGGGPLPTSALLEQIEMSSNVNPKLLEFSMDLALEEDPRFDEVGSAGKVLWFLHRLEPQQVLETPIYLRYNPIEYERSLLTNQMLILERELDDELSPIEGKVQNLDEVDVRLIYPHWRSGTLPLSPRVRHLFPTAYEAPRIRFTFVDSETGEEFPAWVVRANRYVFGLKEWYEAKELIPGSVVRVQRGKQPGQVILKREGRRSSREWVRTVLVGSDGGIVFAMLKQTVAASFDERMAIAVPDTEGVDQVWTRTQKERMPFERVITNTVRELAKLNPQNHVHASELYAAVNIVRRCPPGPIMALLTSNPSFVHVGDLHFRFSESDHA